MVRKVVLCFLFCLVALATGKQTVFATEPTTEIQLDIVEEQNEIVYDTVNNSNNSTSHLTEEQIVTLAATTAVETISDIYDEGTLNSTYINYFRDYMGHLDIDDHYLHARTGQYTYTLFYGDISLTGSTFNMGNVTRVDITTTSGYNSSYTISSSELSSYNLNVGNNIVYSDLGSYPMFEGRSEVLQYVQTISIAIMCLCMLTRGLFKGRR